MLSAVPAYPVSHDSRSLRRGRSLAQLWLVWSLAGVFLLVSHWPGPTNPDLPPSAAQPGTQPTAGARRRTPEFDQRLEFLAKQALDGRVFTENQIVDALGPPTRAARWPNYVILVYYDTVQVPNDSVIYFHLTPKQTTCGFNASSVNSEGDATIPLYTPATKPAW